MSTPDSSTPNIVPASSSHDEAPSTPKSSIIHIASSHEALSSAPSEARRPSTPGAEIPLTHTSLQGSEPTSVISDLSSAKITEISRGIATDNLPQQADTAQCEQVNDDNEDSHNESTVTDGNTTPSQSSSLSNASPSCSRSASAAVQAISIDDRRCRLKKKQDALTQKMSEHLLPQAAANFKRKSDDDLNDAVDLVPSRKKAKVIEVQDTQAASGTKRDHKYPYWEAFPKEMLDEFERKEAKSLKRKRRRTKLGEMSKKWVAPQHEGIEKAKANSRRAVVQTPIKVVPATIPNGPAVYRANQIQPVQVFAKPSPPQFDPEDPQVRIMQIKPSQQRLTIFPNVQAAISEIEKRPLSYPHVQLDLIKNGRNGKILGGTARVRVFPAESDANFKAFKEAALQRALAAEQLEKAEAAAQRRAEKKTAKVREKAQAAAMLKAVKNSARTRTKSTGTRTAATSNSQRCKAKKLTRDRAASPSFDEAD